MRILLAAQFRLSFHKLFTDTNYRDRLASFAQIGQLAPDKVEYFLMTGLVKSDRSDALVPHRRDTNRKVALMKRLENYEAEA